MNNPFVFLDWFIRICKWLRKKRGFFWGTLILGLGLNILASLLFTSWPWVITLKQSPIGWTFQNFNYILFMGIILLLTDSIIYLGSLVSPIPSYKELKRTYLIRLINETKMLTLKGIPAGLISESVPIDEVFIPLMFRPNRPRTDYPLTDKELDYYRNSIMTGVFPEELDRVIIEAEHSWQYILKEKHKISFDNIWERLTLEYPVAVIQGYPGMGKSTLMERLTLHMARRGLKLDDPNMSGPMISEPSVALTNKIMIEDGQPLTTLSNFRYITRKLDQQLEQQLATLEVHLGPKKGVANLPSLHKFFPAPSNKSSPLYSGPSLIPLLLRLGEYATERAKVPTLSLFEYLTNITEDFHIPGLSTFIHRSLSVGSCLVMLDGLDEVSDPQRRVEVQEQIKKFVKEHCEMHGVMFNRFLITSRVAGYDQAAFPDYLHYTIAELSQQQIHYFLPRWCRTNIRHNFELSSHDPYKPEEVIAKVLERRVKELTDAVENNQGVRDLAENPLLLSLLAVMQQNSIELPRQRVELYSVVTRTLLENRNIAKKLDPIPELQAIQRLGPIAFQMQEKKNSFIRTNDVREILVQTIGMAGGTAEDIMEEAERFLKRVRERGGLFVQRTGDFFGFLHRTFQEYFAARYILNQIKLNPNDAIMELAGKAHRSDALWREPFLLAVAYQSNENEKIASEIIWVFLNQISNSDEESQLRALLLAAQCLIESKPLTLDATLEKQIVLQLLQIYEKAQWNENFEACKQIEDAICRWLLSLPREAYRPPILATLQAIITDKSQVGLQSATLTLLIIITEVLKERHSTVIDTFIPILLSLGGLSEIGKYKPITLDREADPYIADLAIIGLLQMLREELLANVRNNFKYHPDHLYLLANYSLEHKFLFHPSITSYVSNHALEETYTRWFKLQFDNKTSPNLEWQVEVCITIYEDLINNAKEVRYPNFLYLINLLQNFSRTHSHQDLTRKWREYLLDRINTEIYIDYQELAILWIILFPDVQDVEMLALRIKKHYMLNDGSMQNNAKRFIAAIANRMRHEPRELNQIRSGNIRTPRDLLYLRNMLELQDLQGIRELISLGDLLLTHEVAGKTIEQLSLVQQNSHINLIDLIDSTTIILGRVLKITKNNERGIVIERELQQFILVACSIFALVERQSLREAILDIIRFSPSRTLREIKFMLQLADEVSDESIQQACAYALERAKPVSSEAWAALESGKQSSVKAIRTAVEAVLIRKEPTK